MKQLSIVCAVILGWAVLAYGYPLNPQGTSGAPVAVSTAAVIILPCGQRGTMGIKNQGSQTANTIGTNLAFCAPGPPPPTCGAAGTGGTFAPTAAGVGWPVAPIPDAFVINSPDNINWIWVESEWDCICGATNGCEIYGISLP